jgi:carbon monoxide dehydrogenase subunit G
MPTVTNRIRIGRPIEDVFAVLTDVNNTAKWFPRNVEEHWTSPPPHGVGSTRHAVVSVLGRRTENDALVTEYQPPFRAAMKGTSEKAALLVTLIFARDDGGTRVDVTTEVRIRGAIRLLGPIVSALYGREWAHGLANLKRMMESGAL